MANFDELDLDFELDAPLGGGGRPSELTSDPRADEWAAAATTTHRIGHVRDISLADDEEDFAAASLGSRSVAGDDVVGRARRGGPGSDVSSIEIMRGAEDRESNPLSVGGRDSDRFLGRPDDDDAGLVDLEPVGAADLAAVGAADDDEMGFAPPPLDDDDGMDAGLLGPRASGSLGAVDDLAALEAMDEDGAAAAEPDDRSGGPMDVDAAPPAAAPRPKRRRPRRAVDLADAAAALDTDTIKGWMRDRSAIVDVKRPRYDAVAAAPADPLAPRLAPTVAPELAAVLAQLRRCAKATPAPAVKLATPNVCAPFQRGTGYKPYVVCAEHSRGHACKLRDECSADLHVLPGGRYALYDCLVRDADGNIVVEDGRAKCVCGAPWSNVGYSGICTSSTCGYEGGLSLVRQCESGGKTPPDYMYTWDDAQKALADAAKEEADKQAAFEKTPLAAALRREMRVGFSKFKMDEDSWNNPRPPLVSLAASETFAAAPFGIHAKLLECVAPAEPCPVTATEPSFAAQFDGEERASRHRSTTAAPTERREILNEGAVFNVSYMDPPKTLDEVLPDKDHSARSSAGNRVKKEKKAAKEQRLENAKKAQFGEGLDYNVRCPAELNPKNKYGCGPKNSRKKGCRFWHAPDGKGAHPKFVWDPKLEERVECDKATYKSKWDAFCKRCAASKAAGAKCVCKTCPEP